MRPKLVEVQNVANLWPEVIENEADALEREGDSRAEVLGPARRHVILEVERHLLPIALFAQQHSRHAVDRAIGISQLEPEQCPVALRVFDPHGKRVAPGRRVNGGRQLGGGLLTVAWLQLPAAARLSAGAGFEGLRDLERRELLLQRVGILRGLPAWRLLAIYQRLGGPAFGEVNGAIRGRAQHTRATDGDQEAQRPERPGDRGFVRGDARAHWVKVSGSQNLTSASAPLPPSTLSRPRLQRS